MTIKKNRIGVGGFPHNRVLIFNDIFSVLLMAQHDHFVSLKWFWHTEEIFFLALTKRKSRLVSGIILKVCF